MMTHFRSRWPPHLPRGAAVLSANGHGAPERGTAESEEEEGSCSYTRAEGLAAEFECAAETKARLRETARRMAYDAGMSSTDPQQSRGYDGSFIAGTSALPKHDSGEYAQPV
ncbi:unnamed protein product [Arctogadus glacialis]